MFHEIHTALRRALNVPLCRQFTISPKTGEAVLGDLVMPTFAGVRPLASGFDIAKSRRGLDVERVAFEWEALVQAPGLVTFDELEESLATPIHIEVAGRRPLVATLSKAIYAAPPDQSASSGSSATFLFLVFPPTLRI